MWGGAQVDRCSDFVVLLQFYSSLRFHCLLPSFSSPSSPRGIPPFQVTSFLQIRCLPKTAISGPLFRVLNFFHPPVGFKPTVSISPLKPGLSSFGVDFICLPLLLGLCRSLVFSILSFLYYLLYYLLHGFVTGLLAWDVYLPLYMYKMIFKIFVVSKLCCSHR